MHAITICAVNYLPFAHVLGTSFLKYNSESKFSILVVDSKKVEFERLAEFSYFSPDDLNLDKDTFENMALYYDVTELSTALKPSALKLLFQLGSEKVIYLDPDIQVFDKLSELELTLNTESIVLTPHTLYPIPRDGLRPTEADILGSGTFNLGFIGLTKSQTSLALLDWWEERLRFDSISDPEEMLFTDQRWIDLVPSYFTFYVLRDSAYNVAYWNLHERNLSIINDNFFVDGKPLKFFHFSGYRPESPWILSKYVSDNPRVVLSSSSELRKLFSEYAKISESFGWRSETQINYGYANFDSGKPIPKSLRRLYREDCIKAHLQGKKILPPDDWQVWATSRSIESGNLSRILFSLWKSRPDLKRRYPDATGTEAMDLQAWAVKHGVSEEVIDIDLIGIGNLELDDYEWSTTREKGINIAGYLLGELGLGQSARLIYQAASQSKYQVSGLNSNRSTSRQKENFETEKIEKIFPVIIAIVNADHFKFWVDDIGLDKLKNSRIIGVWAWETEDFPENMHTAFQYVDEIWAVSNFVKTAIEKHTNKPVYVMPTPIIKPKIVAKLDRKALGILESQKYNLFIFDYSSVFNRKNPLDLVKAHIGAFPNGDGPMLIIKSINGDKDAYNREKLRFAIQNRNDIKLIEDYLSREQLTSLLNECSAYISLHRSEGYGLTMAEAMSLGKPVIATAYSGNLDFMNDQNSILIPYKLVEVGVGSKPYPENSFWAEPNVEKASEAIKKLYFDQDGALQLGQIAAYDVLNRFSVSNATKFIENRMKFAFGLAGKIQIKIRNFQSNTYKIKTITTRLIRFVIR